MTERKKAVPGAATPETAAERDAFQQRVDHVPTKGYHKAAVSSTNTGPVSSLLGRGEENALTAAELARIIGTDVRTVRALVESERRAGKVILGSRRAGGGLFLPAEGDQGRAEITAFIRATSAQARSMLGSLRSARAALQQLDGQVRIEGEVV